MLCHRAPITDLAIDREGRYLATAGLDGTMKVWDIRKFQEISSFEPDRPVTSLDISATGLIAMGIGRKVQILKDAYTKPQDALYLSHALRTPNPKLSSGGGAVGRAKALLSSVSVSDVVFRPLEDSLCIGHSHGITSIIVPGSGESNFDTFEANPFISQKQRREEEVQSLLNKLSYDMIGLGEYENSALFIRGSDSKTDIMSLIYLRTTFAEPLHLSFPLIGYFIVIYVDASFVGSVDKDQKAVIAEHHEIFVEANKKVLQKKVGVFLIILQSITGIL